MRKLLLLLCASFCFCLQAMADYHDHRGHNVDSLETVMAKLTASDIEKADDEQLLHISDDISELMNGFLQINGVKSEYYARMALGISLRKGWHPRTQEAAKIIGQHFWAKEQYDSAAHYYVIAMKATEAMQREETDYSETEIDNALSQMYGTLGNLYSMMDSTDVAMELYEKAGVLFRKHGWDNSCAVLYYNMGETMREKGSLKEAERYYQECLGYSIKAEDSLAVATAYKGLGSLYLDTHKTSKAIRYLNEANHYFADHEDEELQARMESLDYTSQVLELQKRRMRLIMVLLALSFAMTVVSYLVFRKLKNTRQTLADTAKEKEEITEVLENTVESISPAAEITLKPREKEVLDLISKGYTNAQIAEALCLSPETIKWYKKKLFAMFDASNSAELVSIATEHKVL